MEAENPARPSEICWGIAAVQLLTLSESEPEQPIVVMAMAAVQYSRSRAVEATVVATCTLIPTVAV